ncbi:MAG TPA: DUF5818 domain-containing protein [Candidatus Limnocylindrales bacterium]|nr:DUF5818 domain-containing protein [Candidatus Limnocylindrales bacterium]
MRKTPRPILPLLVLAGMVAALPHALFGDEKTFRGEIADTQCALNVHSLSKSHKEMIAMQHGLATNADCARFCVKERGGKFVLQSNGKVYRLDKPEEAEPFAGQQVKILGTLDPKTNTITVRSITPVKTNSGTSAASK